MSDSENRSSAPAASTGDLEIQVNVFGRTDVGLVRNHNEDNFIVADLSSGNRSIKPEVREHRIGPKGSLFAVCDGMGGAAAGEVASQIAVDTIYEKMAEGGSCGTDEELARRLNTAIVEAGQRIFTAAKVNRKRRGMGTTVTAAILNGPRLVVGQVGDSRAYLYREGQFVQLTKDQSLVQQLIDAKQLTEEEARSFDKNNIILQALGTAEQVHVDVTSALLADSDVLVMCSDGLSGLVPNDKIRDVIRDHPDPVEACRKLTDLAREAGGHDNITVIVARFTGAGLAEKKGTEELVYRKFHYSAGMDTTARKLNPLFEKQRQREAEEQRAAEAQTRASGEPGAEPPAQAETPVAEPVQPDEKRPPKRPPRQGIQAGLLAGAGAALVLGVALMAYILSFGKAGEEKRGQDLPAPGSVQPMTKSDQPAPADKAVPSPAAPTPKAAEAKGADQRRKAVVARPKRPPAEDEPPLAPTPIEKIVRPEEARTDAAVREKPEPQPREKAEESAKPPVKPAKAPPKLDDNPF